MKYLMILIVVVGSLFAYSQTKAHLNGEIKGSVTDQKSFGILSPVPQSTRSRRASPSTT